MSLIDEIKKIEDESTNFWNGRPDKFETLSRYLFDDTEQFLEFYNYKFFRFGSYINDMYKIAVLVNTEYFKIKPGEENYEKFYSKYRIYFEYKVKQYLEFKEIDDGKARK